MTAETLKPFLTPGGVEKYSSASESSSSSALSGRSRYFIVIGASALVILLTTAVLGLAIWNSVRVANLQTEVDGLTRVIDSMHKRLGLTYLDDLNELEKDDENNNALIDDELPDDDDDVDNDDEDDIDSELNSGDDDYDDEDEDDDDDEDSYTYDEMLSKIQDDYDDEEDDEDDDMGDVGVAMDHKSKTSKEENDEDDLLSEADSGDGNGKRKSRADRTKDANFYMDFEKFLDSKKNKQSLERKTRSVASIADVELNHATDASETHRSPHQKSIVSQVDRAERRRSPMRPYSPRRRKLPLYKSGGSSISAKTLAASSEDFNELQQNKPAAHFHLTHKIPYHHSTLQIHTYNGDMYIGKPSWTNERDSMDSYFHMENGVLTVHESGLYFVYAQVCYHNHYPQNGFIIFHGHKPFLQCLIHMDTDNKTVINTCHTSGLIYLKRDEHIHIRDFHADRRAHLEETNNRSYFGLIKV